MDCPTEETLIRDVLDRREDVLGLSFNLMRRELTVDHLPAALPAIKQAIRALGLVAERASGKLPLPEAKAAAPAAAAADAAAPAKAQ